MIEERIAAQVAKGLTMPRAKLEAFLQDISSRTDDSLTSVYGWKDVDDIREVVRRLRAHIATHSE